MDRSVALASKAFVSFFPTIIVVASFAPHSVRQSIYDAITRRTGVEGNALATFKGAFASSDDVRRATGFLGLVFTLFYVNSFTTALSRVYMKAWRRPKTGRVSAYVTGVSWLMGIVVYFALIGALRAILGAGPQTAAFAAFALCTAVGLWWITPWLKVKSETWSETRRLRTSSLRALNPLAWRFRMFSGEEMMAIH